MSDPTSREWRFYIDDMSAFAEKVIAYTEGLDQERFVSSGLNYDATVRNLELIGEAGLNQGDCFAYALAMQRNQALLFKGDDFGRTDVRAA